MQSAVRIRGLKFGLVTHNNLVDWTEMMVHLTGELYAVTGGSPSAAETNLQRVMKLLCRE